jgi:hypothetical protein
LTELVEVIGELAPNIRKMQETVDQLNDAAEVLGQAVLPLGELVGRLPKRLVRTRKPSDDR